MSPFYMRELRLASRNQVCYTRRMSMQPTPHRLGSPGYSPQRPRAILIGLIALCGLFVYGYTGRLAERDLVQGQIIAERSRLDKIAEQNAELREEYGATSAGIHVDPMARGTLDYVLPGDVPLIFYRTKENAPTAAPQSDFGAASAPSAPRSASVWQQWVDFFTTGAVPPR